MALDESQAIASDGANIVFDTPWLEPSVIYIATDGDIELVTQGGSTIILQNVFGGSYIPVLTMQVNSAGTTIPVGDIVRLY